VHFFRRATEDIEARVELVDGARDRIPVYPAAVGTALAAASEQLWPASTPSTYPGGVQTQRSDRCGFRRRSHHHHDGSHPARRGACQYRPRRRPRLPRTRQLHHSGQSAGRPKARFSRGSTPISGRSAATAPRPKTRPRH